MKNQTHTDTCESATNSIPANRPDLVGTVLILLRPARWRWNPSFAGSYKRAFHLHTYVEYDAYAHTTQRRSSGRAEGRLESIILNIPSYNAIP